MAQTPLFSFRFNLELKARLQAIADSDGRTLSHVIDVALTEYAARNSSPAHHAGSGGFLYVLARSDGKSKLGVTKDVANRLRQIRKEPRNAGVHITIAWVSQWLPDVAKVERKLKEAVGRGHRGKGSSETVDGLPDDLIAMAVDIVAEVMGDS